jgi:hypothetical protein
MACAICEIRRPRRFCPGVGGEICTICCGTEREVTVTCPLDCAYLQEARRHEKPAPPAELPNQDIRVSEELLQENEDLLFALATALFRAAAAAPGVVDSDVRQALEALIRTYRTLESGIYFETRPANPLAGAVCHAIQQAAGEFRRNEQQRTGISHTRDADVLRVLAFLQRYELNVNNGRPRGRAFLDALRGFYPESTGGADAPASSIILP